MAGMDNARIENFVLRLLAALVSSMIVYRLAFREWANHFLRVHPERGLGPAAGLLFQSIEVGLLAAIGCFVLVFFLMRFKFPILRRKNPDHLS
jgi:hypothetical protein